MGRARGEKRREEKRGEERRGEEKRRAEQSRAEESRGEERREDQRRERLRGKSQRKESEERARRKKMQVREKVAKSRNTVFVPMVWGSGGSKSRLAKAAGAEQSGEMRDEKLHAFVARSTFGSQSVQSTPASEHFWKLR